MTDTKKLEDAITKSGFKKYSIAEKIGIDRATLTKKINNVTEFKASEIAMLSEILDLSAVEKDSIFYME